MAEKYTKRRKFEVLRSQLEIERSSFLSHWRDLGDFVLPRRPRFQVTDTNRGDRRNQKIIDSTATLAARTLRSGMMGGITSPARPWFRLTTPDPGLAEFGPVKEWLYLTGTRMSTVFLRSNVYNVLPIIYGDIGVFGTSAMLIEEDFDSVLRAHPIPIGSYCIANNYKLRVDTFYRELRMTVKQLVERFGKAKEDGEIDWSNFSTHVKNMYDRSEYESWIDVRHFILPNEDYDMEKAPLDSKFKKFKSVYYESGGLANSSNYLIGQDGDKILSEKGYDFFPVLCPRWEVTGEDSYGTDCPGMVALGDIKQLQLGERRIAQAIEKMVNPPMVGSTSLRNVKASILPGGITYEDTREGNRGFRPAHEVNPRVNELELKQDQIRNRIRRAFFEDLFLMLANDDRSGITAREINERHEEKLLALGPVLEQLNQDMLDPLIDNTFYYMDNQGLIPPPPPELQGMPLKVEYISVMAQAQKLVGIAGIERFMGFVGQVAAFDPSVLDKVKTDQAADVYADLTSVVPSIVRSDEEVAAMREQRAQVQQQQEQMAMMQQGASTAKDLAKADIGEEENALSALLKQAQAGQIS
jgi:hypothetical protein